MYEKKLLSRLFLGGLAYSKIRRATQKLPSISPSAYRMVSSSHLPRLGLLVKLSIHDLMINSSMKKNLISRFRLGLQDRYYVASSIPSLYKLFAAYLCALRKKEKYRKERKEVRRNICSCRLTFHIYSTTSIYR